ncbi:MAG: 16S rRNA (uracil(1498)-N(3))-methyltransferase [Candidatus Zixiibacteriota bacterium]
MITNFYTNPENVENETLTIDGEEARHILSVLRHKAGDTISVVDGCGTRYNVQIEKTSKTSLQGKILSLIRTENEPTCHVTLAQAVCRQERMDFLIEKATEIGVSSVIPILTERSLIRISGIPQAKKKVERWRRIAIAGMKQSLRTVLPEIEPVIKFEELLPQIKSYDLCLIASPNKGSKSIRELRELKRKQKKILLIVGPEAGFTEEELALTEAQGAIPITLGTRRLRTETAGIVFLSLLLHQLGDLG